MAKTYLVKITSRRAIKLIGRKFVWIAPRNPAGTFQIFINNNPSAYFLERGQFNIV